MTKLPNYALGHWQTPDRTDYHAANAITGAAVAEVGSGGLDFAAMLDYARNTGGPALRRMTFHERGRMLKKLALHLHGIRKKYYPLSYQTGATKADSWVDIDGGIGTLFAYASLRKQFPDQPFAIDGDPVKLSQRGTFAGHHILTPKRGVAVHINAFNFPIWGMLEKISVNLLAGMPAVVKASEITSFLTQAMVKDIIDGGFLPEGALQLVCGSGEGILDSVMSQDVVTFTGSASTGKQLRAHPRVLEESVPFTLEADSLNAAVLGPDAVPGTKEFDLFIKEVRREMTTKTGQKCTAIRRVVVPENLVEDVQYALSAQLQKTTIGDPQAEGVRMGALVSQGQRDRVRDSIARLRDNGELLYGGQTDFEVVGASADKGAFLQPTLLLNDRPFDRTDTHTVEAFGPVCTLLPYQSLAEAIEIVNLGKGSLVSTIVTNDPQAARDYVYGSAAYHGRVLILNEAGSHESTGHGSPLPGLVHGGPGRAGGGEEMGGTRGVKHYMQRTALQGHPTMLTEVLRQYQPGAAQPEDRVHPFRKYFEELEVGETLVTAKHTVTDADITNFANVSGDHFYAHVDATSLDGTIFEQRVAHGYYILAKAAGLFVDAKKGPVLLNYGIDNCRFTKPVYPGTTIGVTLTVLDKTEQEQREEEDYKKGIVRWRVEAIDQTGETVMLATILTMVKLRV